MEAELGKRKRRPLLPGTSGSDHLPLPDTEEETSATKEPKTSEETDNGECSGSPQKGLEEMRGSGVGV
jgi:hypothetical protein